jgi:hypothetical protein
MTTIPSALHESLRLVRSTPGYAQIGVQLGQLDADGRIKVNLDLEDRAQASLLGMITLGPEAAEASVVSLAQTLVHEAHHLRQNPLLKTVSFGWVW